MIHTQLKQSAFDLSYTLGSLVTWANHPPPPVLAYHSIDNSGSEVSVSGNEFNRQMLFLKENGYQTISMTQYAETIRTKGKHSKKSFVLTFDDGYLNNYTEAYPLLKKLGYTATIYLITRYMGGYCDWITDIPVPRLRMLDWDEVLEMTGNGIDFGAHTITHPHLSRLRGN